VFTLKNIKKYSLSSETKQTWGVVGGYTNYETLTELICAYLKCKNKFKDSQRITNVGLSLEFVNSLDYKEREEIKERELAQVIQAFNECGVDDFEFKYGNLFIKKDQV
jgi:hypothetical protein